MLTVSRSRGLICHLRIAKKVCGAIVAVGASADPVQIERYICHLRRQKTVCGALLAALAFADARQIEKMPSSLNNNATPAVLNTTLGPILDAAAHLTIKDKLLDFARVVFGAETTDKMFEERKAQDAGQYANGGVPDLGKCTALARGYISLRDQLGETANAEELKAIAVGYYLAEIWDQEVAKVQAGY